MMAATTAVTNTIKTDDMRAAAYLLTLGLDFCQARMSLQRPGIVEFCFTCPAGEEEQRAQQALADCAHGMDVRGNIGEYERAFARVRRIIEQTKEANKNDD